MFVNEEIKCSATACINKHECLIWPKDKFCTVTSTVNDNKLFVYCKHEKECPYKHLIENRILCTCPVRLEIYQKYNV